MISLLFCGTVYSNVVTKVKGKKILFSLTGLKPIGPGGVVTISDAGVQIGKAKVKKVGRKVALGILYQGAGLVDKGYQVKVLAAGKVGKKQQWLFHAI